MSPKYRWVSAALTAGTIYLLIGVGFPNPSSSSNAQFYWRLAAWLMSSVVFASHIVYEHVRLRNVARTTAIHVSLAVAFGAFALSIAANFHGLRVATAQHQLLLLSMIIWPVITAVPAFLVSFACAAILARIRAKHKNSIDRAIPG